MSLPSLPAPLVRAIAFAAIVVVGIAGSFGVYRSVQERDEMSRAENLTRQIDGRQALIRETLRSYEDCLYSLGLLFSNSQAVTPNEFSNAATELSARYPGVYALQWVPLVPAADRPRWEQAVLPIMEHAAGGALIPAKSRAQYFPVAYSEPHKTDWNPLGCDLSAGTFAAEMVRARALGSAVLTGRITLLTSQGNRDGVMMILPLFGPDESARSNPVFRGFLISVFRVDDLLVQSWNRVPSSSTDVMFVDDSATSPDRRVLYYHAAQLGGHEAVPTEPQFRAGAREVLPLEIGSRRWEIIYRPNASWTTSAVARPAGLILLAGLVITGLVAGLLVAVSRHTRLVEREVSERTAELIESRRQLDNLLGSLPGMAYRCLYLGDEMQVLYASEGTVALIGYSPDEFISGTVKFREVIAPEDLETVRTRTLKALNEDRIPFDVEYRVRTRDGREKWVLSRGRGVYGPDGRILFFEGLAIDISAQKEAEAAKLAIERKLLESQKLESLGLLAGGIAHDFNNLLAGILGHANLARTVDGLAPDTAAHLQKIEASTARAADLCQQMLAYSGRGRFVVEAIDLTQLTRETVPLLRTSLPIHARLELVAPPEPAIVMGDATQIRQIAMNLILNAGDALGAPGGDIVVTTGCRAFDRDFLAAMRVGDHLPPAEYVFLEVRDTGCGMSQETLAKIFDPFFTTKFTGRGLGLAAVLGIVRGHAGGLRVQSTVGRGTTFTLLLPPSSAPVRAAVEPPATPWKRQGKILVIDDEGPVRDVAAELIRTFGFTVVTATDGTNGIERFNEDPAGFDLVFLDLTMPGLDGEETLARLRAIAPAVRVLLVSGYSENDRIAQMASAGPLAFMQKPFTRNKLERKLREVLG